LQPAAPRTLLSGTVDIAVRSRNAPVQALVDLRNARPGRWDEGLLPLRQVSGEVVGSMAQRQRLDFRQLELRFADAAGNSGLWTGSATWLGHELKLQTQVQELWPQRLDSRAAAMRLSGPLNATLLGLPSPDPAATTKAPPRQLAWNFDFEGLLDKAPQAVQLAVAGVASDGRLEIQRAQARTGAASAELSGTLLRVLPVGPRPPPVAGASAGAKSGWRVQTQGSVKNFDPLPWWPGERNTVWHRGPHRLTAQWSLDVLLPPGAAQLAPALLLQRLSGNGTAQLRDSLLAGLPLAADITLAHLPGSADASTAVKAEIRAAGNVLTLDGHGDPGGEGLTDRWRADLQADQLAALAPWAVLHPALADWLPQQGQVSANVIAEGRWPQLRTEGSARAAQLRMGGYGLKSGTAQWSLDTSSSGPVELKLDLAGLQSSAGGQAIQVDQLTAEVRGTVQSHQINATAALPAGLSATAAQVLGLRADRGTQARLQAQGAWLPETAGAGQWRGTIERLLVSAWDGLPTRVAGEAPPAATWAEARNLRTALQVGPGGVLLGLTADAGRLLVGATAGQQLALRWDEVQVDLRPATPHLQLRAAVEPFDAVPFLARLQPTMGWSGNLKLGARLDLRATERMDADVVVERIDGDLNIDSGDGLQLLGLTELRATLAAHDGLWQLTPLLKGRGVGELSGNVRTRTAPDQRWPPAGSPLEGSVTARATDIGIWAPWVPAGWRLTGDMNTTATVSGTWGTPRYTGAVRGTGIGVRNLLQGVNVTGGEVSVLLEGETARIERFSIKGGEGRIDVSGEASWAGTPTARLQLKAERFRALGRLDRMLIASGQATLTLQRDRGRLEGRFSVDEGLFDTTAADAPSLDNDVTVRGQVEEALSPAGTEPTARRRNFALAVDIDLGDKLRVRGRGLDSTLRGELRLTNPDGRLAVNGSIRSVGGTYAAYGQKLEIERGVLIFTGPADNPRLDVLALRPNIDTRVGVFIAGPAQSPRVRLYAEPEMSDTDKLSWLVLGRAPDGLGRSDTALLQRAAVALLSGEGEAPTDALLKSLGIDEISLRQGDGEVRETVITLGKQLSRRWYVGYERGVNAASGTWQLIYRIAQRFTLRAQSGLENSLDVIWVWRVQETPADASMRKSVVTPK
jgi:translocation and assembly module TamB